MTNNQKMINLFIILGLIGGLLIAVSIAGYRIYSGKASTEQEQKSTEQRDGINNNITFSKNKLSDQINSGDSTIIGKAESSKTELLEQHKQSSKNASKERRKSTKQIIDKIDETGKKQGEKQDKILYKLEDLTFHSYKPLNQTIKKQIIKNLIELKSKNKTNPVLLIEIESGNSQRHKVALELESMLTPLGLGRYGKGNTFMGRFPDYPISLFTNSENLPYAEKIKNILSAYIKEGITIRDDINFPKNFLRIYINGNPEFYNDGTIKVK